MQGNRIKSVTLTAKKIRLELSVIIVNYNVKYFLEQCLCSVQKACRNIEAEVFVVDNASTDGSRAYLEKKFSSVQFCWEQKNLGFGKANNKVLQNAKGDHVLFLNPDTIVPEDCFESCLHFFKTNNACGALGVRMLDGAGFFLKESKRSFPSPLTSFFKMTGFAALFPRSALFARYYAGHLPEHKINEVDVLAGAFMMVRAEALELVKGFDEDFFMYGEDIDLSYRIQQSGYKNYYYPKTCIIHFKGESTQKNSPDYTNRFYDAMLLFVKKHYRQKKALFLTMSASIRFSRLLAGMKQQFAKIMKDKTRPAAMNTAIVAGQRVFNEVLHLVKHASTPVVVKGRIAPGEQDAEAHIGRLAEAASIIKKEEVQQLLFCEGEISFKKIIETCDVLHGKACFLFHGSNTGCIVGSNDKNTTGIFISRE